MKWVALLCAVLGIIGLGIAERQPVSLLPVAEHLGPSASAADESEPRLFVLPLAQGAIVIRSFSRSEWASFQVRAEAWEWIEYEMLAAAIVQPAVTASDAAALPDDLSRTLRRAINEASGFAVFSQAG
jgi:hypothetical protein